MTISQRAVQRSQELEEKLTDKQKITKLFHSELFLGRRVDKKKFLIPKTCISASLRIRFLMHRIHKISFLHQLTELWAFLLVVCRFAGLASNLRR